MAGLVDSVERLKSNASRRNSDAVTIAKESAENVLKYFDKELSSSEIDKAFAAIFDENNGLLPIITVLLPQKEFKDVLKVTIEVLIYVVHHHQKRVSPFAKIIKDISRKCISYNISSDGKEKACVLLQEVLKAGLPGDILEITDIIELLFKQIHVHKPQPSVLQKYYHTLGIIAHEYPEYMANYSTTLRKMYLHELEKQFQKKGDLNVNKTTGCLEGLTEYMFTFQFLEDNAHLRTTFYNYLKCFIEYQSDRKILQRAALELLHRHGILLRNELLNDYQWWHGFLCRWINDSNTRENYTVASNVLDTFHKAISLCIEEDTVERPKDILSFFISYFKKIMSQYNRGGIHEKKVVIKGFGIFSGNCFTYLEYNDVMNMFSFIIQRAQQSCFDISITDMDEQMAGRLSLLPSYIESIACFLQKMKTVGEDHVTSLRYMTVVLMQQFAVSSKDQQDQIRNTLTFLLYCVSTSQGVVFDDFIGIVVYQALIRLSKSENIEGRKYICLWCYLVDYKTYNIVGMSYDAKRGISGVIYDTLMRTVMELMGKLDLQIIQNVEENSMVSHLGLRAANEEDFKIFVKLVEFFKLFLPETFPDLFEKWVQPFVCCVLKESSKEPLVSGFYELLAVSLKRSEEINFFANMGTSEQSKLTSKLICKFLQHMIPQIKGFMGDLQIAAIRVFLAAPLPVVSSLHHHAVEAFQVAFRIGHSYVELANEALVTLQKWKDFLSSSDMRPILLAVLPELEFFLESRGGEIYKDEELEKLERRRSNIRHRFSLARKKLVEIPDSELVQLQRRILSFLGLLSSDISLAFLSGERNTMSWGHTKALKYRLPFKDMKITVSLDLMLPRVIDLALCCSDRQTRITACELLHAIVMFMLGRSKQSVGTEKADIAEVAQKLFMPLLQLSGDPDNLVCQLFRPLVDQLAHWYSSTFQVTREYTDNFMNALLDGITHPSDMALRESSAKCLREFVEWAIRQNAGGQHEKSSINIQETIKKICLLCVHPSSAKRLGGALAFNAIYTLLREDMSVVEEFWFDLLYYFVKCLSLTDLRVTTDIVSEAEKSVEHVARVIRERPEMFMQSNAKRNLPEFEGSTLKDAVKWLFLQCSSPQRDCRRKCREMVCALASHLPGCSSVETFILHVLDAGQNLYSVLEVVECSRSNTRVKLEPSLEKSLLEKSPDYVIHWLHTLIGSLDMYIWLLKESGIGLHLLKHPSSKIISVLNYYVEVICDGKDCALDEMVVGLNENLLEYDLYLKSRCFLLVLLFDFLGSVLNIAGENIFQYIPESFFSSMLWKLLAKCLFEPSVLGFDLRNEGMNSELLSKIKILLCCVKETRALAVVSREASDVLRNFVQSFTLSVAQHLKKMLQSNQVTSDHEAAIHGIGVLTESGFLTSAAEQSIRQLQENILQQVYGSLAEDKTVQIAVELQPLAHSFAEELLHFSLLKQEQVQHILSYILDATSLKKPYSDCKLEYGEHFLCTFRKVLLVYLLQYPNMTISTLIQEVQSNASSRPIYVLNSLVQFAVENKQLVQCKLQVFSAVLEHWHILQTWGDMSTENMTSVVVLLKYVAECALSRIGCLAAHPAGEWARNILSERDIYLEHKSKVLELLPSLASSSDDNEGKLKNALQILASNHFNKLSSELRHGTLEYDTFGLAFRKILVGLQESRCLAVLEGVITMSVRDENHICEEQIQETLPLFIHKLDVEKQINTVEVVYNMFVSTKGYEPAIRKNCVKRFLVPLLKACRVQVVRRIFTQHVKELLDMLTAPIEAVRAIQTEHNIVSRIGAWGLFEVLFIVLPGDELQSKTSPVAQAAFGESDTTLMKDLMSKAHASKTSSLSVRAKENAIIAELFRQMQCAAYSTLAVIICNTKDELKFYSAFLFAENKNKNQLLWDNMIDCTKSYKFPVNVQEFPKVRKYFVNIRPRGVEQKDYLATESHKIATSTLEEDLTRFDFSNSVLQDMPSNYAPSRNLSSATEVVLENDELNKQECMVTLCAVLNHMAKQNIYPVPKLGEKPETLPSWMENLRKCLLDSSRHRNIHLFIVKLILNNDEIFKPYAAHWLYPLMQTVVNGVLGGEINSMVIEVMEILTSWSDIAKPSANDTEKMLASQLLNFLINHSSHSERAAFKCHLEMIRAVVELWKECLTVPYTLLLQKLSAEATQELGIHIAAIFLINGILPWNNTGRRSFMDILTSLVSVKSELLCQVSEVLGMCLLKIDPHKSGNYTDDDEAAVSSIKRKVDSLLNKQTPDKFLHCLHSIQKHYPPIIDDFMTRVLYYTPKVSGKFKTLCLEIIHARLEKLGDRLYSQLEDKGFYRMLHDVNADLQYVALLVVQKMLPLIHHERNNLEQLLKEILKLATVENLNCRRVVYEILKCAYKYDVLSEAVKGQLLEGFVESDSEIQNLVFEFWNKNSGIPSTMPNRFLSLITLLYSPHSEQHFLNYCLTLLLDPVTFSAEVSSSIFEHPLADCEFTEQDLSEASPKPHSFAYSLGKSQSFRRAGLMATQRPLLFQPTVAASPSGTFEMPSTVSSSFIVNLSIDPVKEYKAGSSRQQTGTYYRRRRFVADRNYLKRVMISHEARRNAKREELQHQRKENRDKIVAIYRKYRKGDFPDIQIPHSSLLEPIHKLAKNDVVIGRQMMVLIFSGIIEELESGILSTFTTEVSRAFCEIMQQTRGSSMLISCVVEMALVCSSHVNLDPDLLSTVCRDSGSLMLGSMLLEEKLISLSGSRMNGLDEDNCWLKLAELYQDMDEWDVVFAVFHEKLRCHSTAKLALEAEADKDWNKAADCYYKALSSNDSDNLKDYYYEGFFKCLTYLSDWAKLHKCIEEQADEGLDSLWDEEWNKSNLLPYLFISEIQLIGERHLNTDLTAVSSDFLKTVQRWLADREKAQYMESHLTEELAVFHVLGENVAKARAYCDKCYVDFIKSWIHMSVFAFKQRTTSLQDIHRFSEIQVFLDFATSNREPEKLEELLSHWRKNLPSSPCSLLNWDRRLAYRGVFAGKIKDNVGKDNYVEMYLHMNEAALDNGNLYVARKYLEKVTGEMNPAHRLRLTIGDSKVKLLTALQKSQEEEKFLWMVKACSVFDSCDPCKSQEWNDHEQLQQAACQQMSAIATGMWKVLMVRPETLLSLDGESRRLFHAWTGNQSTSPSKMLEALHNCGLTYLHCAVNVALKNVGTSSSDTEAVAKAYHKIAEYYESTYGSQSDEHDYMVAVLRAMKYGSSDSKYLFPRLLQYSKIETNWVESFIRESCQVPEWMFLPWINQIFACLDKPIGPALHDLVLRIGEAYPQAMMWTYRLSKEKYNFHAIPDNISKRLDLLLLQNTLLETFLKVMSCVVQPRSILEHHVAEIMKKANVESTNQEEIGRLFHNITNLVFLYKTDDYLQGQYFQVLDKYYVRLQEARAVFFSNRNRSLEILKEIRQDLMKVSLNSDPDGKQVQCGILSNYSPWLSNFQLSPWGDYLELPGQYTGETLPLPQYHVRIAGFVQQVKVIRSLRSPIKLTIIGNNAKEYPFLVKYGEDLRQDQRIQQLFNVMNIIFQRDVSCLHRQLKLITYQVIPLTCDLGMIQWLDGTKTLKNILEATLNDSEKGNYRRACEQYWSWLQKGLPGCLQKDVLHRQAYRCSRQDIINHFQQRVDLVPWDIFRRAFMDMSASREEFFARRHKFVCSYATMCVSHWLLGIGDRHLHNCLVRETDGYSVGIDFGHAFGSATQFLHIPELMPFRMTPHIVYLMRPLNHSGLFQRTMVHSLRALREGCQILLAAMEIFVHEPSINWVELAQRQNEMQGITDAPDQWLPQEKVNLARKKCSGANPVFITAKELTAGHSKSKYLPSYLEVLRGNQRSVRAQAPDENLSVDCQVECLLDLATDSQVLGVAYAGWEAWI